MKHTSVNNGEVTETLLSTFSSKPKSHNLVNIIYPYRTSGGHWAYDDEFVVGEPFVMGTSELIDALVGKECNTFSATISAKPLPIGGEGYTSLVLDNIDGEMGEEYAGMQGWYQMRGSEHKNWLCGHLLDWFVGYPDSIFINIKK